MKQDLDQHFLIDKTILNKIVKSSDLNKKDVVLEIGAGNGILTRELSKNVKKVIAIEIDKDLKPYFENIPSNIELIFEDALKIIDNLKFNKIVSNIPYVISEPLFKKMVKMNFDLAVLMTGENFYKILNNKNSKWNYLSKLFFNIEKITDVYPKSFHPIPRVNSVVLKFVKTTRDLDEKERIIKDFVLQDSKKVKNALISSLMNIRKVTKKQAKQTIQNIKMPSRFLDKNVDFLSNKQFRILIENL